MEELDIPKPPKMTWKERRALKKLIKQGKKRAKEIEKDKELLEQQKETIIQSIEDLQEIMQINEDKRS